MMVFSSGAGSSGTGREAAVDAGVMAEGAPFTLAAAKGLAGMGADTFAFLWQLQETRSANARIELRMNDR
jgi:hypothetical protein